MTRAELLALVPAIKTLGLGAYMVLEWWLGRTKRVRANSTIDLALALARAILWGNEKGSPQCPDGTNNQERN